MESRNVSTHNGKGRNFEVTFHDSYPNFGKVDGSDDSELSIEDTQLLRALRESLNTEQNDFELQEDTTMTYIPPMQKPPIDASNHTGVKKYLAKMVNALHYVKETFTDPWKGLYFQIQAGQLILHEGWVDIDKFAAPSQEADPAAFVAASEQEEMDRSLAFQYHERELAYVESNKTWIERLAEIQKNRYDMFVDQRPRHKPYFLVAMSVIQFIVLIANIIYAGGFASPSINPMLGPSPIALVDFGANYQPYTKGEHEVWRLITPIFLHAGFVHLLSNLFVQIFVGFDLERVWGWRIIPIYFIAGIGGSLYSVTFMPNAVSVGASGSLMGLYGAIVADNIVNWSKMRRPKWQIIWWTCTIILFFALGFVPMIDNWTHTLGLIHGFFAGVVFLECIVHTRPHKFRIMSRMAGLLALCILDVLGLYLLYGVKDFHCHTCCYFVGKFDC